MTDTAPTPPPDLPANRAYSAPRAWLLSGLGLALLAAILMVIYVISQTRTVTLAIDGIAQSLQIRASTVGDLLNQQNITLNPADRVTPPVETELRDGEIIRVERAHPILIQIDDLSTIFETPLSTPGEILLSMGVDIEDGTRIFVNGSEIDSTHLMERSGEPIRQITIQNTRPFSVVIVPASGEAEERISLQSSARTVGAALYEAGIELYLADAIIPELGTSLAAGLEVHIQRALPLTITVDGNNVTTRVLGGTTADALSSANVILMGLDYTIPDLTTPLRPDTAIRVIRVKENLITETRPIPFEIIYQNITGSDDSRVQVIQEGHNGIEQIVTRIRFEDGVEINRTVIRQILLVPPQPQILASVPH